MSDLNRKIIIAIPKITAVIEKHTQNDFRHYKTTTLTRRIRRRILVLKLSSVDDYIELLQSSREEVFRLFRDLLISVTAFFRDANAFESLARDVLKPLVHRHQGEVPLRIWIPGCATGQEAYSIAILIAEILEQCDREISVQIFATDLDERALSVARSGSYPIGIQDEITEQRLQRFFSKRGNRYFVTKKIRDMILFSAHNLISDPPFTKVDLISCRNLLIYLGAHLQKKLIPLFHYSLQPGGYLFLGPAETLSVNRELFRTLHTKHRLYQRRVTTLDRPQTLEPLVMNLNRFGTHADAGNSELDLFRYSQQIILSEFAPQWIVCDDEGQIHSLSSDPAPFLKITGGNFKNNIITMAHENLRTGLRAAFSESKEHRRRALSEGMSIPAEGGIQRVHITVQPVPEMGSDQNLHLVVFHRIGSPLQATINDDSIKAGGGGGLVDSTAGQVIEQLELELLRTRDALERTVQELEASNEELKSSNEELLSMNEEMQSANEELEASKEELQTSNENLVRSNNDIQNLLRSTRIATIFLDNQLCIRSFTPAVKKIYDLRESDVGRKLTKFASEVEGMPPLPDPRTLSDDDELEDMIGQIAGRTYIRRVTAYRGSDGEHDGIVVTFSDVTELSDSQELFKTLVDVAAQIVWTTDAEGRVVEDSPSWRAFTGQSYEQWVGNGWVNVVHPDDREGIGQAWKVCVDNGKSLDHEFRLRHHSGVYRWTQVRAAPIRNRDGSIRRWVGMNIDIHDRIMAETNLRRSEELVRTIAENSTNALIMMDEKGYLTYCNQACLEMTGFDEDEIRSKPLHDLIHHHYPDGRPYPMAECPIDRALPEDFSVRAHEDLFFRKDGTSFPVMCAASPIFRHGVPVSTVIEVRDISHPKMVEAELRESEVRFREMTNAAPAMIWVTDENHYCTFLSQSWYDFTGQSEEEGHGLGWTTAVHPDDQEAAKKHFLTAAEQRAEYEIDFRLRQKDGSYRWVIDAGKPRFDKDGNFAGYVGSVIDTHDRHEAVRKISISEERLRNAAEAAGFGMLHADLVAGTVGYSDEFKRLIGLPDDAEQYVLDHKIPDWVHPDDREICFRFFKRLLRLPEGVSDTVEHRVLRSDGEVRWVRIHARPIYTGEGEKTRATQLIGTLIDITQQREFEASLREAREQAEAANESKSAFLANMSHEIRTPMTAILGYTDLIAEKVHDDEALMWVRTIRRNGDFLLDIINDILDLSKIEAGKLDIAQETFSLARLIEDVRVIMDVRASERGIQLSVEYQTPLPAWVLSDGKRLKQILINLVGNAIKFTPEGAVTLQVSFASRQLRFDIIDTGVGISDKQLANLFQPFSQGDGNVNREFGGTGLGLAISQRLAQMLGGEITVESALGRGSKFTVIVAVAEVAESGVVSPNATDHALRNSQKSVTVNAEILIVDDRRDIRFLSKTFLTQAGANVSEAEDGQLAIDMVKRSIDEGQVYHLILLDMQMPRLDGYQTAQRLRQLGYHGPIIALTADAMQGDMNRCIEAGCNDYLSKPIDKTGMLEKIEQHLQNGAGGMVPDSTKSHWQPSGK